MGHTHWLCGDMTLIVLLIKKPSDKSIWVREGEEGRWHLITSRKTKKKKPMREQYDPCIGKINKAYESLWVVVKKKRAHFHFVIEPCHNTL